MALCEVQCICLPGQNGKQHLPAQLRMMMLMSQTLRSQKLLRQLLANPQELSLSMPGELIGLSQFLMVPCNTCKYMTLPTEW